MDNCVFCRIVTREEAAHLVYSDDDVIAFLGSTPINAGHTLVIPRQHQQSLFDLEEAIYSHLMLVVKHLVGVVDSFAQPTRVGLVVAGWDVPHAHVHIIPMHDYHDITSKSMLEGELCRASEEELERVAQGLRAILHPL